MPGGHAASACPYTTNAAFVASQQPSAPVPAAARPPETSPQTRTTSQHRTITQPRLRRSPAPRQHAVTGNGGNSAGGRRRTNWVEQSIWNQRDRRLPHAFDEPLEFLFGPTDGGHILRQSNPVEPALGARAPDDYRNEASVRCPSLTFSQLLLHLSPGCNYMADRTHGRSVLYGCSSCLGSLVIDLEAHVLACPVHDEPQGNLALSLMGEPELAKQGDLRSAAGTLTGHRAGPQVGDGDRAVRIGRVEAGEVRFYAVLDPGTPVAHGISESLAVTGNIFQHHLEQQRRHRVVVGGPGVGADPKSLQGDSAAASEGVYHQRSFVRVGGGHERAGAVQKRALRGGFPGRKA